MEMHERPIISSSRDMELGKILDEQRFVYPDSGILINQDSFALSFASTASDETRRTEDKPAYWVEYGENGEVIRFIFGVYDGGSSLKKFPYKITPRLPLSGAELAARWLALSLGYVVENENVNSPGEILLKQTELFIPAMKQIGNVSLEDKLALPCSSGILWEVDPINNKARVASIQDSVAIVWLRDGTAKVVFPPINPQFEQFDLDEMHRLAIKNGTTPAVEGGTEYIKKRQRDRRTERLNHLNVTQGYGTINGDKNVHLYLQEAEFALDTVAAFGAYTDGVFARGSKLTQEYLINMLMVISSGGKERGMQIFLDQERAKNNQDPNLWKGGFKVNDDQLGVTFVLTETFIQLLRYYELHRLADYKSRYYPVNASIAA